MIDLKKIASDLKKARSKETAKSLKLFLESQKKKEALHEKKASPIVLVNSSI